MLALAAAAFATGLAVAPTHPVAKNESKEVTFEEKLRPVPDHLSFTDYKYHRVENTHHAQTGLQFSIDRQSHDQLLNDVNATHNSKPYTS